MENFLVHKLKGVKSMIMTLHLFYIIHHQVHTPVYLPADIAKEHIVY